MSGTTSGTILLWHIVSGGFVDAAIAAVILAMAITLPRTATAVGVVVGIVAAVQVYFALTFGAPATWSLLAYRSAVDPHLLEARTVAVTVGAVVVVVVAAILLRRVSVRAVGVAVAAVFVLGVVGRIVDDGRAAQLGLSRSPLLALLPSIASSAADDDSFDGFDADVVYDEARRAPVQVLPVRPKHIVLFISESTASRFVDATTMPTLTALADDHGLRFDDHVAESPVSIKALFSLLCGLPPLPEAELESAAIPRIDCGSLPETLTSSGFDAGLFHGGYFAFTDKLAFFNERGFSTLVDGENVRDRDARWHNGWGVDDRAIVDEALAFLDARPDRTAPSFVVVVPLIPHYEYFLPPDAPRPFGTRTLIDRYKNGLRFADDVLLRLVDGYKARGLYDSSLFVVVGDHGEAFDEHPRNRLHGGFVFEENLRAPLIFHSARALPAGGQISHRPSAHANIAATILDFVDVTPHSTTAALTAIAGHSLIATDFAPTPTVHFTSYPDRRIAWRGPRLKLVADDDGATLFDVVSDPHEQHPIDDAVTAARLRRRAERVLAQRTTALRAAPILDDGWLVRVARAANVPLVPTRVFNMVRPCIPFATSASDDVVITLPILDPPARSIGIGIDATSLQQRRGHAHAVITGTDGVVVELDVDSVFDSSSRVARVAPQSSLTVTIAPSPKAPTGCLWVTP